jgi:hypothetical protein
MRSNARGRSDAAFVCLWTGSKYGIEYVEALHSAVRRNCTADLAFICVTDRAGRVHSRLGGVRSIPLDDPSPGWWNKVRLFDPGLTPFRYLVYIDLDVVILRSIDHLVRRIGDAQLVHAQDLLDDMSSSFMVIDTESPLARDVVDGFELADWTGPEVNDQHYLQEIVRDPRHATRPLPWEDHYSYKYLIDEGDWRANCNKGDIAVLPVDAITMLNLHGHPKPHDVRASPDRWPLSHVVRENWR